MASTNPRSMRLPDYGSTKSSRARDAFADGDINSSIQLHNEQAGEQHVIGGGYIKSAVFGGLDGIITTFATVTTVAGAKLSATVILVCIPF
eukprot:450253-Amorphochlora_amoeboformis.AAC.1